MKFISFKAKNIHGYLNISIVFNEDLSILIGENGSGKTTALKLMQALISPSFRDLILIEFDEIVLTFKVRNTQSILKCTKNREKITITSSDIRDSFTIDNIENNELYYFTQNNNENIIYEKIQEIPIKHRKHPIIEYIIQLPSPIFLGLERKFEFDDFNISRNINSKIYFEDSYAKNVKNRRLFEGNLNSGLADAQFLIQTFYNNIRSSDERNINRMKENLLLTSFKYREFKYEEFNNSLNNWRKKKELLNKKDEVLEVLAKVEGKDGNLTVELTRFFDKLSSIVNEAEKDKEKEEDSAITIELIINMSQIDKIFDLVSIVQSHKERTDKMYSRINDFIQIINGFYVDSDKMIELDSIGNIVVKRPNNKKCPISALSSGERQLLVIFAHAFFNKHNDNEKIFIIDEPELSLHLRWQQIFLSTIIENCPKTQFLMATHSPDIVDEFDDKIVEMWRK